MLGRIGSSRANPIGRRRICPKLACPDVRVARVVIRLSGAQLFHRGTSALKFEFRLFAS
jgi:hypothetical protein